MPKKTAKIRVFPAAGGLNLSSIPGTAPPSDLVYSDNLIFSVNGSRKKRWGLSPYYRTGFDADVTGSFRGMIDYWRNNAGVQARKLVLFVDGDLWADNGDGHFSKVTGSNVILPDDQVCFEVFVGFLIAGFENRGPLRWTQSGNFVDLGGSPPPCSIFRVHQGRVWAAGNKGAPHRLYFSALDNPEDWSLGGGGGFMDIEGGDSDPIGITAIFPSFFEDLYVAKRRSIHRIKRFISDDLSTITYKSEPVIKGLGCICHNTAIATQNDIIWASESGVHSLQTTNTHGNVSATFLSFPIHDIYNNDVNFQKAKNMWGCYVPELNSYLLAYTIRGRSTNTEILGYNFVLQKWFQWHDIDCAAVGQFVDRTLKTRLLIGQEALNIGQLDSDRVDDYGASYSCLFTTPIIYPMAYPDVTFNFKNLFLFFEPQSVGDMVVTYKIDNKEPSSVTVNMAGEEGDLIGEAVIGEGIIGGGGVIKKVAVPLEGEGSGIQFTFSQTPESETEGEDFNFFGFVTEAEYVDDSSIPSVT